jgi:S1-C subfamily serine protease
MSEQHEQEKMPLRRLAPRRSGWPMAAAAGVAAVAIIVGAVRGAEHDRTAGLEISRSAALAHVSAPSQAPQLPSFADLAERVTPAVVSVYVSVEETAGITEFGEQGPGENILPPALPSAGSGSRASI